MIGYVTLGTNDLARAARFYDALPGELSPARVDALHRKALELGGTDEGAPGPCGEGCYAGYFRDLDGNKLNVFVAG